MTKEFMFKGMKPGFYAEERLEIQERKDNPNLVPLVRDYNEKECQKHLEKRRSGKYEGRKNKYTYSNMNYEYEYPELVHHSHKRRKYVIGREYPKHSKKWPVRVEIHCTRWTDEEWNYAFRLREDEKKSYAEIARILERTYRAVWEKFNRMKNIKNAYKLIPAEEEGGEK